MKLRELLKEWPQIWYCLTGETTSPTHLVTLKETNGSEIDSVELLVPKFYFEGKELKDRKHLRHEQ